MQDFEVYMDPNIILPAKALQTNAIESKTFDFHRWGKETFSVFKCVW